MSITQTSPDLLNEGQLNNRDTMRDFFGPRADSAVDTITSAEVDGQFDEIISQNYDDEPVSPHDRKSLPATFDIAPIKAAQDERLGKDFFAGTDRQQFEPVAATLDGLFKDPTLVKGSTPVAPETSTTPASFNEAPTEVLPVLHDNGFANVGSQGVSAEDAARYRDFASWTVPTDPVELAEFREAPDVVLPNTSELLSKDRIMSPAETAMWNAKLGQQAIGVEDLPEGYDPEWYKDFDAAVDGLPKEIFDKAYADFDEYLHNTGRVERIMGRLATVQTIAGGGAAGGLLVASAHTAAGAMLGLNGSTEFAVQLGLKEAGIAGAIAITAAAAQVTLKTVKGWLRRSSPQHA